MPQLMICIYSLFFFLNRKIIDGKGAQTVFNGNRRGQDLVFTFENHHAAGVVFVGLFAFLHFHG